MSRRGIFTGMPALSAINATIIYCSYCKLGGGQHAVGCPVVAAAQGLAEEKDRSLEDWKRGHRDGASGKPEAPNENDSYKLGYAYGKDPRV